MKSIQDLVRERRERRAEQEVLAVMVGRAPNGLRVDHIARLRPDLSLAEIAAALETLETQGRVERHDHANNFVPGRVVTSYLLTNRSQLPFRDSITIGGVEFPRLLHGDITNAEDLNAAIEAIAEYDSRIENRISDLALNMTRRYWANIGAMFALFVAVFALILRGSEPLVVQGTPDFRDVFLTQLVRLGPLALVLLGFAVLMWLLLRRI